MVVVVVVLVETLAVEVIVVDVEVVVAVVVVEVVVAVEVVKVVVAVEVVVAVVFTAVDKFVRSANDAETFWLLSLGVGELFGMLITLVTLDDSDQELETLLLACHIPCYVYLFSKLLICQTKKITPVGIIN